MALVLSRRQQGQGAQSLALLKPPLVRGTEINCGKFWVPLKPYGVSYSRALACPGHKDTEDDAAMGMDTRLGQHRRHQRGNFHILTEFTEIMGMAWVRQAVTGTMQGRDTAPIC